MKEFAVVSAKQSAVSEAARHLSVIVPAYNEESYLAATVDALRRSAQCWADGGGGSIEVLVVDDGSTDATAAIARRDADRMLRAPRMGIGAARNVGAQAATGDVLVFVDADTLVEPEVLARIAEAAGGGARAGAVTPVYRSERPLVRLLLAVWRWWAPRQGMAQGVCQFFDRELFAELGGYDPGLQMGEDSDLFERARRRLQLGAGKESCVVLTDVRVHPSMRRYEGMGQLAVTWWTNPLTTRVCRRSRRFWHRWYEDPPR